MGVSQHEVRQLVRLAKGKGLRVEKRGSGHFLISNADGDRITLGGTPGSDAAVRKARSHIRRLADGDVPGDARQRTDR